MTNNASMLELIIIPELNLIIQSDIWYLKARDVERIIEEINNDRRYGILSAFRLPTTEEARKILQFLSYFNSNRGEISFLNEEDGKLMTSLSYDDVNFYPEYVSKAKNPKIFVRLVHDLHKGDNL